MKKSNSKSTEKYGFRVLRLTIEVQYICSTKSHQMVMDQFNMLKKHTRYPPFIPMGLLGLGKLGYIPYL